MTDDSFASDGFVEAMRRWGATRSIWERLDDHRTRLRDWLADLPQKPVRFWQRGRRGWSYRDAWSTDRYIAEIVMGMLQAQIEEERGCPGYGAASTWEKWRGILGEIQAGFAAHLELVDGCPDKDRRKELARLQKRGLTLFARWFDALWT